MGIFDFLFGKPEIIQDAYFGKLLFAGSKTKVDSYFEGRFNFKPTGKEIELHISADLNGPSNTQKAFVESIQVNYELVRVESNRLIADEFRNWKEDFVIADFDAEFTAVFLSIPRFVEGQKIEWEIAYESVHDLNHMFTVNFEDWQAISVQIDG
jgi:hypothetical protein